MTVRSYLVGNYFRKAGNEYYPINNELMSCNNENCLKLQKGLLTYINLPIIGITGYQKGTFRGIESDLSKLASEDFDEYPFLTINKDGVLIFNKIMVIQQISHICWLHSILNVFLLPDRMRLMIGNNFISYITHYINKSQYGRMYSPSLFDGQLHDIPNIPIIKKDVPHFRIFMIFKYIYIYLYDFYEINKTTTINPKRVINPHDYHVLDKNLNNRELMSIIAHTFNKYDSCLSYYKNVKIDDGKSTLDIFDYFNNEFSKEHYHKDFYRILYGQQLDEGLILTIEGEAKELESWILRINFEKEKHVITGFKKNDGYFMVDSVNPKKIYQIPSSKIKDNKIEIKNCVTQDMFENVFKSIDILLAVYVDRNYKFPLNTENEVREAIIQAKEKSDKERATIEEYHGGKQRQTILYQSKKYVVCEDMSTKSKYIRVKRQRVYLTDIRRRYRYIH